MSMVITEECVACAACEPECPTGAIMERKGLYVVDRKVCVDCEGYFDRPQCGEVCPVEGAIIDHKGRPLNASGSLQGTWPKETNDGTVATWRH
ncbi:MAG: 4Fe-4S binding protein [Magnetococcales bacterium]|nr:4Fe-4S binding protein [Magnetococcales bacterium]